MTVFATSHDAGESVDYRVDCGGDAVGILTDTGFVPEPAAAALTGVDLLVLESNHDVEWLRSGPYPYSLKQRILANAATCPTRTPPPLPAAWRSAAPAASFWPT